MKKITEINDEIKQVLAEMEYSEKAVLARLKNKLSYLKICKAYLESNPSEDFLKKEVGRIENRVNKIMELCIPLDESRALKSDINKHKKAYESEMGIVTIKKQLSTLYYLLK
jgi:hypothetical protein